jgi:hypothetical protein
MEEVAERGIRWGPPQFKTKRLGERGVVTDGETLQIPQALATAQDPEHRHQQQIPGWNAGSTCMISLCALRRAIRRG